jgi:hypothetical protein
LRDEIERRVNDLVAENNGLQKKMKLQKELINELEKENGDGKVSLL